jgi:hypothetical protein
VNQKPSVFRRQSSDEPSADRATHPSPVSCD